MKTLLKSPATQYLQSQPESDPYWWSYRVMSISCFGVARASRARTRYRQQGVNGQYKRQHDAHQLLTGKHDKQRELDSWKSITKSTKTHLPVAATVSTGHRASLCVDLVPVETPLRPRQSRKQNSRA